MSCNLMGKFTFADATIFCILNFLNMTGMPKF